MKSVIIKNNKDENENEVIEILRTDNIVSLKKKLNSRLYGDEKTLIIYKNNTILPNNDYVGEDLSNLFYEETDNESEDIILYIKRNYCNVPKYLQFPKSTSIKDLKNKICDLFIVSKEKPEFLGVLKTIHMFKADGTQLNDELTLEDSKLEDDSKVKIWQGESLRVSFKICDPLQNDKQDVFPMDLPVTETIKEIKEIIKEKIIKEKGLKYEILQLFSTTAFLEDNKQLLYYPVKDGFEIYFVDMKKKYDITIGQKIRDGKYAKIFHGEIKHPGGDKCIIFQYDLTYTNLKNFKVLKYEIVTRLKLANNTSRFVEMLSMYEEEKTICIAMEYLAAGSLESLLGTDKPRLTAEKIKKYSWEIAEGIFYMHNLKILHRNLNCGSVLIDDNDNAKLCNFHLSKYLFDCNSEQLLRGIKGSKIEDDICWVAPEVMKGEPYGFKADIWSFGVTMIEMITRNRPYPNLNPVQAAHKIVGSRIIEFERNIYPESEFDEIIDKCLQFEQDKRPMAEVLMHHLRT